MALLIHVVISENWLKFYPEIEHYPSRIQPLSLPDDQSPHYVDIVINKWLDLWSIAHSMNSFKPKIERSSDNREYEGKIVRDIFIDLDIFLENEKRYVLAVTSLSYDGIYKTKLIFGQVGTSIEEVMIEQPIPGNIGSSANRRDIIYDIYLQFKLTFVKLSGEFYLLPKSTDKDNSMSDKLSELRMTLNPAKFVVYLKDIEVDVVMRLVEIDKRFKLLNLDEKEMFHFRKPKFEFDYYFGSYLVEEYVLPTNKEQRVVESSESQSALKQEADDSKPDNSEKYSLPSREDASISEAKEIPQTTYTNWKKEKQLRLASQYDNLVQNVFERIRIKSIRFQKDIQPLIRKLTEFIDSQIVHMPSILELGYVMKQVFGYFTSEEYSFLSSDDEQKFLNQIRISRGEDFIKDVLGISYFSYSEKEDKEKVGVYRDSLTPLLYTPKRYIMEHLDIFGDEQIDFQRNSEYYSYWKSVDYHYLPITDEYVREPTLEEIPRLDNMKKAFKNWVKMINIISSFDGLQKLYEIHAYKIAERGGENTEKSIYWDARVIETSEMIFSMRNNKDNSDPINVYLVLKNVLISGLGLAKVSLSSLKIEPISSRTSNRVDFRYDMYLEIKIPWLVVYADYYVKQNYETLSRFNPGKLRMYLQTINIKLNLNATEIDKKYTYLKNMERSFYFRNPKFFLQFTVDNFSIFENTSPSSYYSNWAYVTSNVSKQTAKRVGRFFFELFLLRPKGMAKFYEEYIKPKLFSNIIPMPSIFEVVKVMTYVFINSNKKLKFYDEDETKEMEKKVFEIISKKSKMIKFIENSLRDARKYFSSNDENILKLFKESCTDDNNDSIEEIFHIFKNRELFFG